ncbi:SPX-domain-containing protein [Lichtheimia hyalospora FSU 10163]|nr:SPX-domain-containing protein [Lichtheimia hyalospora FSU 10163]
MDPSHTNHYPMKFAHTLILNAVPDWIDQYVDYDRLKKLVYQIERLNVQQVLARRPSLARTAEEGSFEKNDQEALVAAEAAASASRGEPLADYVPNDDDKRFIQECDQQLDKVCKFFAQKEAELLEEAATLRKQFDSFGIPLQDETLANTLKHELGPECKLEKLDTLLAGREELTQPTTCSTTAHSTDTTETEDQQLNLRRHNTVSGGLLSRTPTVGSSPPTHPITRSKTVSAADSRASRFHPNADDMTRTPWDWMESAPLRNFRFLQRRDSVRTLDDIVNVDEFNRYYNFRARCTDVYIMLSEIKSYVQLNHEAFRKILKKWDKITGARLQTTYCKNVIDVAHPFQQSRLDEIEMAMKLIQQMYAAVFTNNDETMALSELKLHMREKIHFERNTVWKDMVSKERETFDARAVEEQPGYHLPWINFFVSKHTLHCIVTLIISLAFFIPLLCIDTLGNEAASKCLALLVFVALLWAFETLPLFATAYLIPLLIVPMDIVRNNGDPVNAADASKAVFSSMFNGTILVLLGGFAIAAALSKHGITKAFAAVVLSKAGTRPQYVILVNMYLAAFLCMWISNVATPVLCFSLVQPILRTLPPHSSVGPCLILGIALASCIGGLSSPISSPQNIIAIQMLNPNPGWGIWFAAALPLTVICILTTWGMLLLYFRPGKTTPRINAVKSTGYGWPSYSQVWVSVVCLATIALWCSETANQEFWGDNGTIAIIPFVLLFGTSMLNKTDLNNFLWSVVTLAQGGMALGFAVDSSGLLDIIGHRIANGIEDLPVVAILFIFGILVLVFATFVSHTVSALIILPIVKQVGEQLSPPQPNILVMVTALTASVAMGLPVSGFPNMNAIMQEDGTGKTYLKMRDFICCGIPASIIAGVITILLGYGIISGIGY